MMATVQLRRPGYDQGRSCDCNSASCLGRIAAVARGTGRSHHGSCGAAAPGNFHPPLPRLKIRWPGWTGAIVMVGFCSGEKSGGKN